MAGPSSQSKGFKPLDLMEGYGAPEVYRQVVAVDDVLSAAFGPEPEIKVVTLSFLMGQYLRESRVTIDQAFSMTESARSIVE